MLAPRGNGGIADGHAVQAGTGGRRAGRARGGLTLFGPRPPAMGIRGGSIVNCPRQCGGIQLCGSSSAAGSGAGPRRTDAGSFAGSAQR